MGPLGCLLGPLGCLFGRFGRRLGRFGCVLGPLGCFFGRFGRLLGPLGCPLGLLGCLFKPLSYCSSTLLCSYLLFSSSCSSLLFSSLLFFSLLSSPRLVSSRLVSPLPSSSRRNVRSNLLSGAGPIKLTCSLFFSYDVRSVYNICYFTIPSCRVQETLSPAHATLARRTARSAIK